MIPYGQLLAGVGQFFGAIVNGRNSDKRLSKDSELEEKRAEVQKEIAKLNRENQENIAAANIAFQAIRLV